MSARPLRSWMFVPGNRGRFLEKLYELRTPPDAALLDLEDGVPPAEKEAARGLVADLLRRSPDGPLRAVRVNAVDTPWFADDLAAVVGPGLEAICLPKVEDAETVRAVASALDEADPTGDVRIVAAIESAAGLLRAPAIAATHPRVLALMFGAEDYALDIGLGTVREAEARELLHARSSVVVAAAAARLLSIDGVFPDLDDAEGLAADALQARRLGFGGKATFNPRQIDVLNAHFSPSADELEHARRVVAAFDRATARGEAAVALNGQLVDQPIVMRAQRTLGVAAQLAPGVP